MFWFSFVYGGGGRGDFDVYFAYSGGVVFMMKEDFLYLLPDSGDVGTMTIVGVSFRTGLRG